MIRILMVGLLLVHASLAAAVAGDQDIDVKIAKNGPRLEVDVSLRVHASRDDAWRVLTDYNDMVRFVSTLTSSTILRQEGNDLAGIPRGNPPAQDAFDR